MTSLVHVCWARNSRQLLVPELGLGGAAEPGAEAASQPALVPRPTLALGASGATRALLAFETLTFPISMLFGTPVPTWWFGAFFIAPA